MELFHGGAAAQAVSDVLRHRSIASTRPYVTEATLAVTMTAAAPRGRPAASHGRWASAAAVRAAGAPGAAGGPPRAGARPVPPPGLADPALRLERETISRVHQRERQAPPAHAGGALLG